MGQREGGEKGKEGGGFTDDTCSYESVTFQACASKCKWCPKGDGDTIGFYQCHLDSLR